MSSLGFSAGWAKGCGSADANPGVNAGKNVGFASGRLSGECCALDEISSATAPSDGSGAPGELVLLWVTLDVPLADDFAGVMTFAGFDELKYLPPPDFDEKIEYGRRPAARGCSRRASRDIEDSEESE